MAHPFLNVQPPFDNAIPQWTRDEYQDLTSTILRFENQIYGFVNTFGVIAFNPREGFMITPQGIIRGTPLKDLDTVSLAGSASSKGTRSSEGENAGDVSIDCVDGYPVVSRTVPGKETDLSVADFVIYRFIPENRRKNPLERFIIIAIIEVKRSDLTLVNATRQLRRYMETAALRQSHESLRPFRTSKPPLLGILLSTETITTMRLESHALGAKVEDVDGTKYSTGLDGGRSLWNILRQHAQQWLVL